jgi:hypothetical protein
VRARSFCFNQKINRIGDSSWQRALVAEASPENADQAVNAAYPDLDGLPGDPNMIKAMGLPPATQANVLATSAEG